MTLKAQPWLLTIDNWIIWVLICITSTIQTCGFHKIHIESPCLWSQIVELDTKAHLPSKNLTVFIWFFALIFVSKTLKICIWCLCTSDRNYRLLFTPLNPPIFHARRAIQGTRWLACPGTKIVVRLTTITKHDSPDPLFLFHLWSWEFGILLFITLVVGIGTSIQIPHEVGMIVEGLGLLFRSWTTVRVNDHSSPFKELLPYSSQATLKFGGVLLGVGITYTSRRTSRTSELSCDAQSATCNTSSTTRLSSGARVSTCIFFKGSLRILVCCTNIGAFFFLYTCLRCTIGWGLSGFFLFLPPLIGPRYTSIESEFTTLLVTVGIRMFSSLHVAFEFFIRTSLQRRTPVSNGGGDSGVSCVFPRIVCFVNGYVIRILLM